MRTNVFKQAILLRMQPALGGFLSIALLAGWSLSHQAPAGAAPLEIPTGQIATNKPELVSAIYVPGSVTVTVLPQAADLEEGQPTMVLCAIVEVEFALPGRTPNGYTKISVRDDLECSRFGKISRTVGSVPR